MQFENEVNFNNSSRAFATTDACDLYIQPTMFGCRFSFSFSIKPTKYAEEVAPHLTDLSAEIYLQSDNRSILIGNLSSDINEGQHKLTKNALHLRKHLDLDSNQMVMLSDMTHIDDVRIKFELSLKFLEDEMYPLSGTAYLRIPHSEWLKLLNNSGMRRFELIAIHVPVSTSHLHKPFSEAINKIREAEREYLKGNWNAAAASCRDAWNTVLSTAPPQTPLDQRIDYLLSNVTGDPKRKEFAKVLMKGLHDLLNQTKHLQGNVQTQSPPGDLKPADALLCIHWYSAMIGYLASVQ
jgi:hypothetical protein